MCVSVCVCVRGKGLDLTWVVVCLCERATKRVDGRVRAREHGAALARALGQGARNERYAAAVGHERRGVVRDGHLHEELALELRTRARHVARGDKVARVCAGADRDGDVLEGAIAARREEGRERGVVRGVENGRLDGAVGRSREPLGRARGDDDAEGAGLGGGARDGFGSARGAADDEYGWQRRLIPYFLVAVGRET